MGGPRPEQALIGAPGWEQFGKASTDAYTKVNQYALANYERARAEERVEDHARRQAIDSASAAIMSQTMANMRAAVGRSALNSLPGGISSHSNGAAAAAGSAQGGASRIIAVVGKDLYSADQAPGQRDFDCVIYGSHKPNDWSSILQYSKFDYFLSRHRQGQDHPPELVSLLNQVAREADRVKDLCRQSGEQTRQGSQARGPRTPY